VVDDFLKQYKSGSTPNPCINCNKYIKFDLLLKKAIKLGCDYVATGHYVKKIEVKSTYNIQRGRDKSKDQSYFLYNLNQNKLKHIVFPLGGYTKTQVKSLAKKYKLPVTWDRESQEICFIVEKRLDKFLKRHLKLKSGKVVTTGKKIVGKHDGLALYTLGQRRGIKIGGIGPFYVVKKNSKRNELIVSNEKDDKLLYTNEFEINNANWIDNKPENNQKYEVQIRYQAKPVLCRIKTLPNGKYKIILDKSARAVTIGQSAVIYKGMQLIGGGIIFNVLQK